MENTTMKKTFACVSVLALALGSVVQADLTPAELASLDDELTPMGAIRAGNEAGTIPAWEGGVTAAPAGYVEGGVHVDPFADDTVLYTVTESNAAQYNDILTPGHRTMLSTYGASYRMPVYESRRSASVPDFVVEATRQYAPNATLTEDGNGVVGAAVGVPFPVPENGLEAIWNHLLRFRGVTVNRTVGQAMPTRSGDYTLIELEEQFYLQYSEPGMTPAGLNNLLGYFRQEVKGPARLAGSILLVHDTINQVEEPRRAWTYNTGQRRVRRAPNIAHDNPGTASDGMRTSDQLDMFNGSPERYYWRLVGRQELLMPYNSYGLHNASAGEVLTPLHINQSLTRYELHRVWVVEATVKSGTRHIYERRVFYFDEDSWQILAVEQYDSRGELWRMSEAHCINYYDLPTFWSTLEVHVDLKAGRYLAFGLDNGYPGYTFGSPMSEGDFTPASLRRQGIR